MAFPTVRTLMGDDMRGTSENLITQAEMTLPQQGVEKLSSRGKPLGVIGVQRGRSKWPLRLTTLTDHSDWRP